MKSARITLALFVLACGPSVDVTDDGSTSEGTAHGDPGSGSVGETTSPTSSPSTTSATSPSTTSDPSSADESDTTDPGDTTSGPVADLPHDCDLWLDDCPRGSKCMPWANDGGGAWNATKCTPIAEDPNDVGEPCTVEGDGVSGVDDCVARAMCWNVDPDTNMGECAAFCEGSEAQPTCADACDECYISGGGPLILCLPICDPLAQDCGEGQACYPVNQSYTCAPDASDDAGAIGEACEFINVCDPGLFCAPAELVPGCEGASGCCAPFCNVLEEDPCAALPGGVECVPWEDEVEEGCGSGLVGGCLLPE